MAIVDELREQGVRVVERAVDVNLLGEGFPIRVRVFGVSVFDRRLKLTDLGFKPGDDMNDWISPGSKSYAPQYTRALKSWGVQCRQLVARFAMDLDSVRELLGSSWRFLLYDVYPEFRERWDELMGLRDKILSDIERDHSALVREAVTFYRLQAEKAWCLLQQRYDEGVTLHLDAGVEFGPEQKGQYLDWVAEFVEGDFPTITTIRESVQASYIVNMMFDPTSLARAQQAEAEARQAQAQAHQDEIEAEDRRWELSTTREAREAAIRQAELERMRQRIAETTDPWREAMDALLGELSAHIQALIKGYQKHGNFRGRSLDRLDRMTELWRVMGGRHLGAAELEEQLNALNSRADQDVGDEQRQTWTDDIAQGLTDLRIIVQREAGRLNPNTRASAIEVL